MREITDGMKKDLALVECDNHVCQQRGTRTICYQKWQDCPDRMFYHQILVNAQQEQAVKVKLQKGEMF